jgi:hypothetical protein
MRRWVLGAALAGALGVLVAVLVHTPPFRRAVPRTQRRILREYYPIEATASSMAT